jgi:hypothetical protein
MLPAIPLFLFAIIGLYGYPPHAEVSVHNDLEARFLTPDYCNSSALNESYDHPIGCADMFLAGVYPSMDGSLSSSMPPRIAWGYSYHASSQDKIMRGEHGCTSSFHNEFNGVELNATLCTYMGIWSSCRAVADSPVRGMLLMNRMERVSNATVRLYGNITFKFNYDRTISSWQCDESGSCGCSETVYPTEEVLQVFKYDTNTTYRVESGAVNFFADKPVLGEQWAPASELGVFAFSRRSLWRASAELPGGQGNFTMREFYIEEDSHGLWHAYSNMTENSSGLGGAEYSGVFSPFQLFPGSYDRMDYFNSSYFAQGAHAQSLLLQDCFYNNFSFNSTVYSRLETAYNSTGEDNSTDISDPALYRKSPEPPAELSMQSHWGAAAALFFALASTLLLLRKA